jgi:diketogulonate reductase-like aldo/keto reductase
MSHEQFTPDSVPRASGMPMLGLGTWQNEAHDQCVESVRTALETGYRHVDTAQAYRNERAVGEGLAAADVDREDVFLATKVWTSRLSSEGVVESTAESLDRLGTEYLDLLYVHWPAGEYDPTETLAAFDELHAEGLVRNVGVSNFEPHHVDRARQVLEAPVFANQVEMHPLLPQEALREYATDTGLELVAYSPLARGEVFEVPTLSDIADDHGVSEAQVSLAWLREKGVTAIPKATGEAHIRDNWASLGLELSASEVERIDAIEERSRQVHPDFAPAEWD